MALPGAPANHCHLFGREPGWVGSGHLREKSGSTLLPCVYAHGMEARGLERSTVSGSPQKESPGMSLGIMRLVVFAEAAAHVSLLIRFIIFLTGWMCSSRL